MSAWNPFDSANTGIPAGPQEQQQAQAMTPPIPVAPAPPVQQSPRSMPDVLDLAMGNAVGRAADRLNAAGFYVDRESLRGVLVEEISPVMQQWAAHEGLRAAGRVLGEDQRLVDRVVAKRLGGQRRVGSATELIGA